MNKNGFALNSKICIAGIVFFAILGPICIFLAAAKHGSSFVSNSFHAIANDPIYLYACVDLVAIFLIISYWSYRDARRKGLRFWPWVPAFFIFGTPAFLIYVLYSANRRNADTK